MGTLLVLQSAVSGLHGFTLVEVSAALGILSVTVALAGNRLIQVFSFQPSFQDKAVAATDLRHAGSWFSGDALNAQAVSDENGDPANRLSAADSMALSWTGRDGTNLHSPYRISGDSFEQDYDGQVNILTNHVVADSAGFIHCGNLLALESAVEDQPGIARKPVLWTYLRRQE